jgi:hypothetical protein
MTSGRVEVGMTEFSAVPAYNPGKREIIPLFRSVNWRSSEVNLTFQKTKTKKQAIMLSADETNVYRSDGYLVPKFELSDPDLDKLQQLTLQLVADNPQARGAIRSPHIAESGSGTFESQAEWLNVASNPKLLDMVEQFIGPDIILWTSTLFYKAPWEAATPWHRDGCPFLTLAKSEATITAWIAVFDVTRENGALRVIPISSSPEKFEAAVFRPDEAMANVGLTKAQIRIAKGVFGHLAR